MSEVVLGDSAFVIISIITVKLVRYDNYHDNNNFYKFFEKCNLFITNHMITVIHK